MFRRFLLGLLTALIVARPFVLGEDPGLMAPLSDPSNMVLSLLWLVLAAAWAGWRAWPEGRLPARVGSEEFSSTANSRRAEITAGGTWYGGVVEAGLLATAFIVFVGASTVASYKHPAQLIAWEWLTLFVALFTIRQLAVTADDRRLLLAAFLATVVALSAFGIYQYTVQLPQVREKLQQGQSTTAKVGERSAYGLITGGPGAVFHLKRQADHESRGRTYTEQLVQRLEANNHAFGTFAHPNSFASFLVLLLPAVAVAAVLRWRQEGNTPTSWLTGGCALLTATALWTTHSRGAVLGLGVVALAAVGGLASEEAKSSEPTNRAGWRRTLRATLVSLRHRKGTVLAVVVSLAVLAVAAWQTGLGASALGKGSQTALNRLDYWEATLAMIRDHPWLGVGAGNFDRFYPRYMEPTAYESIRDPHNFLLEIWSSYGIFALIAFLIALVAFFYRVLIRPGKEPSAGPIEVGEVPQERGAADTNHERVPRPTRWEFYLGGMAGLLLGYLLSQGFRSPDGLLLLGPIEADEALITGLVAGVRSIIWFAAFALFEGVPWTSRSMRLALAAGVAAVLVNLSVSGGISFPSVAQPLWLVAGLALSTCQTPHTLGARSWPGRVLPVPVAAGFALAYFVYVFVPVVQGYSLAVSAFEAARYYRTDDRDKTRPVNDPRGFLKQNVLKPLEESVKTDQTNAHRYIQLALWYFEYWKLSNPDPRERRVYALLADRAAREAVQLDPNGREGYLTLYQIHWRFAQTPFVESRKLGVEPREAADALRRLAQVEPTSAQVRYRLAEVLQAAGEKTEAREVAREGLRLDDLATREQRKLGPAQREQLRIWAQMPSDDKVTR
jgi:O-Antigen ligase